MTAIPRLSPDDPNNRTILFNHYVYFNLHNRLWSLKALQLGPRGKGRVSGHARTILMMGVTPKVSEAGRLRVIREKRKNVHAGLIGKVVEVVNFDEFRISDKTPRIRYNPYKGPLFTDCDGCRIDPDDPVFEPIEACVLHKGCVYYGDGQYHAECDDSPTFLCKEDCDDWARETGYTGWIRRDCRRVYNYSIGRYREYVSAACAG